jgi:hypothetical protein
MRVVTTCPITKCPLYVSDVKPSLLNKGACGDWGYSPKAEQATDMSSSKARACLRDMQATGRRPVMY